MRWFYSLTHSHPGQELCRDGVLSVGRIGNGSLARSSPLTIHVMNFDATGHIRAALDGLELWLCCIRYNALLDHTVLSGPQQPATAVKLALMGAEVGPQSPRGCCQPASL